jgi:hypothetical protein
MKFCLFGLLFINIYISEIISGIYSISNLEYKSNYLGVSSLEVSSNTPQVISNNLDNERDDLKHWQLTSTSAGWTIKHSLTNQYLAPNGSKLRLSPSLPYSWWISEFDNEILISAAPNNFAISLDNFAQGIDLDLKAVTKAQNQCWILNRVNY